LHRWLGVPDGVAVSADGAWIAVSNHERHVAMLYERSSSLSESSSPSAVLRGATYPHGVRFTADGRHVFLSDTGSRYVHVYTRGGDSWHGVQYPSASLPVMDEPLFQQGRIRPDEGGPKGIDIDRGGQVLVVTSMHQPLAFFSVSAILERGRDEGPDDEVLLAYELSVMQRAEALRARADEGVLGAFKRTAVFRKTQPLRRRLYAALPESWTRR
jgi:sugar lactone lactonase YvrE